MSSNTQSLIFAQPLQSSTPVFSSRETNVRPEIRFFKGSWRSVFNVHKYFLTTTDSGAFAQYPARDVFVQSAASPDAN